MSPISLAIDIGHVDRLEFFSVPLTYGTRLSTLLLPVPSLVVGVFLSSDLCVSLNALPAHRYISFAIHSVSSANGDLSAGPVHYMTVGDNYSSIHDTRGKST